MDEEEQGFPQENNLLLDVSSRVRSVEGRYNLLRDRVLLINNNLVDSHKKTYAEISSLTEDVKEMKEDLFRIKESLKHLLKELELFARREDVKFLEKYINLWNPLKLVTESDVERMIEHHIISKKEEEHAKKRRSSKH